MDGICGKILLEVLLLRVSRMFSFLIGAVSVSCCSFTASLWWINLLPYPLLGLVPSATIQRGSGHESPLPSDLQSGLFSSCQTCNYTLVCAYFCNELFHRLIRQLVSFTKPSVFINPILTHLKIIVKFFNDLAVLFIALHRNAKSILYIF